MSEERTLLVDASVFISLNDIGALDLLYETVGTVHVPRPVANEISTEPAASRLSEAAEQDVVIVIGTSSAFVPVREAAEYLGRDLTDDDLQGYGHEHIEGDIALLACAIDGLDEQRDGTYSSPVVLTDDKPLRQTCRALSIPVSGSIGVLVRAVERGDLVAEEAKAKLEAMDEVGARLSASLYRKAERMIEDAAEE